MTASFTGATFTTLFETLNATVMPYRIDYVSIIFKRIYLRNACTAEVPADFAFVNVYYIH